VVKYEFEVDNHHEVDGGGSSKVQCGQSTLDQWDRCGGGFHFRDGMIMALLFNSE
jgi:hypothetical protein